MLRFGRLPPALFRAFGPKVEVTGKPRQVPRIRPATAPAQAGAALFSRSDESVAVAAVTAAIAGLATVALAGGDPRAAAPTRRRLQRLAPERIVGIGAPGALPAAPVLRGMARTAASGLQLPGGGQLFFPGRRVIAIYGHPGDGNLGVLGEQPVAAAVRRARRVAAPYRRLSAEPVVPAFELIATVASAEPGPDRDFSLESSVDRLGSWVDAAAAAGLLVVLDLQPGRTDFLTQAKRYESYWRNPTSAWRSTPSGDWRGASATSRTSAASPPPRSTGSQPGWPHSPGATRSPRSCSSSTSSVWT